MIDLQVGDQLVIEYNYCPYCEDTIGYDPYGMEDYDDLEITILPHMLNDMPDYVSSTVDGCEARVFEYDGWLFTTCWIRNYKPVQREPNWEV